MDDKKYYLHYDKVCGDILRSPYDIWHQLQWNQIIDVQRTKRALMQVADNEDPNQGLRCVQIWVFVVHLQNEWIL